MTRTAAPWLALAALAPVAHAGVTDNLVTSPTAMAMGNAVTADPPGIESIHFNPAGLARLNGTHHIDSVFVATIRNPNRFVSAPDMDIGGFKDDPINGKSSGPVRQALYIPFYGVPKARLPGVLVPSMGMAYNAPGSRWTFGTNVYLAAAMSIDRTKDPDDPARFDGRLVQLPGPKNSLGEVKFDMRNDNAIYLHDTPFKALFDLPERHRSHGCVRVQGALDFAMLLASDDGILIPFQEALMKPDEEGYVKLKTEVPVRLMYRTAFVEGGQVRLVDDVYGWDDDVAYALGYVRKPPRPKAKHEGADVGP